jgi:hypothetical protein
MCCPPVAMLATVTECRLTFRPDLPPRDKVKKNEKMTLREVNLSFCLAPAYN